MRWMAVDHGTKKIGIAFCDEMEIIASPYAVWPMEGEDTLRKLAALARSEKAQALLVGIPLHRDGQESATAPPAREFGQALAKLVDLPLAFVNEHLTSAEAKRLLGQGGGKPKRRDAKLDAAAAAVMLQEYIDGGKAGGLT